MSQAVQLRSRTHRISVWIILGTLPFYLCGIIVLVGFGGEISQEETATQTKNLTATVDETPAIAPTLTPGAPTTTLQATPTQYIPPQPTAVIDTPIPPEESTSTAEPISTTEDTTEATATVDATGTYIIEQRQTLDAQRLMEMVPPEQGPGQPATQGQPMPPGQDRPR